MKEWKPILLLARLKLVVLMFACIVSIGVILAIRHLNQQLNASLQQVNAELQSQQSQLEVKKSDLLNIESHIKRYETLKLQGLVGEPDRAMWVEQIQKNRSFLGLPDGFTVQLLPAKLLDDRQESAAIEGAIAQPYKHEMEFELRNVHEVEVLTLINTYRKEVRGRFRLQSCKFGEPKEIGFIANCTLRFVTIPAMTPVIQPESGVVQ
jgi:hypothetical protein